MDKALSEHGEAICDWMEKNCPDYKSQLQAVLAEEIEDQHRDSASLARTIVACMTFAFEAGRKFQQEHPTVPMNDPNAYKV